MNCIWHSDPPCVIEALVQQAATHSHTHPSTHSDAHLHLLQHGNLLLLHGCEQLALTEQLLHGTCTGSFNHAHGSHTGAATYAQACCPIASQHHLRLLLQKLPLLLLL